MYQSFSLRACSSLASIPFPPSLFAFPRALCLSPFSTLDIRYERPLPSPWLPSLTLVTNEGREKKRLKKCTSSFTLKPFVSPLFSFPLGLFRIILNWCFRFPLAKQTIEFYSSFVVLRLSDYGLMTRRFVCCLSSSIFSGLDSRMGLSSRLLCFCLHRSRVLCLISFATSPFRSDDDIQFLILIVQLLFYDLS